VSFSNDSSRLWMRNDKSMKIEGRQTDRQIVCERKIKIKQLIKTYSLIKVHNIEFYALA